MYIFFNVFKLMADGTTGRSSRSGLSVQLIVIRSVHRVGTVPSLSQLMEARIVTVTPRPLRQGTVTRENVSVRK